MKRRTFVAAMMAGPAGLKPALAGQPPLHVYSGAALAFGTTINVTLMHHDREQAGAAIAGALHAAKEVDRLMSIYDPASQVFQLNRDGFINHPDHRLLAVLEQARRLSQVSGGAFDITVQPLWRVFSAAARQGGLPSASQRLRARAQVNWRHLGFDQARVEFLRPGMALTLNGLAQGYAADLALAAVRVRGIDHALLDTGEFIARGRKSLLQPWTLGIQDTRQSGLLAATLPLNGRSLATSGDYESVFSADYQHHHIFNPASGDSPPELASVSVLAPSGVLADGWSTAFMVMGTQRAFALAAGLPGIDLMTIDKHGRQRKSPGFILI